MANHKSSKKRARQTVVRTERNKTQKSMVKSIVKKVRTAIEAKNKEEASSLLPRAQQLIDRLSKKGIIKPNSAARKNSRLASQVAKI